MESILNTAAQVFIFLFICFLFNKMMPNIPQLLAEAWRETKAGNFKKHGWHRHAWIGGLGGYVLYLIISAIPGHGFSVFWKIVICLFVGVICCAVVEGWQKNKGAHEAESGKRASDLDLVVGVFFVFLGAIIAATLLAIIFHYHS